MYREISFYHPHAIYFLLGISALILLWLKDAVARRQILSKLLSVALQKKLLRQKPLWLVVGLYVVISLVWACAVFAIMGPYGIGEYADAAQSKNALTSQEIVMALDVSASMSVNDMRYGKNRLEASKDILDALSSELDGNMSSFFSFTSHVTQQVPATLDKLFLRLMIRSVAINEGESSGTDLEKTLTGLIAHVKEEPLPLVKTILLITDGGDTLWETSKDSDQAKRKQAILQLAHQLETYNAHLIIIGVGSKKGGNVPELSYENRPVPSALKNEFLTEMAAAANGSYFPAHDFNTIELVGVIVDKIKKTTPTQAAAEKISQSQLKPVLYFQIPLAIAMVLLILAI